MTERTWTFGCPKCGQARAGVVYKGQDSDGFPVRLYQCNGCQHRWATEERRISENGFWSRAHSGNFLSLRRYRQQLLPCKVCPDSYSGGSYAIHKETPAHRAHLKSLGDGAERTRRSYWNRKAATA